MSAEATVVAALRATRQVYSIKVAKNGGLTVKSVRHFAKFAPRELCGIPLDVKEGVGYWWPPKDPPFTPENCHAPMSAHDASSVLIASLWFGQQPPHGFPYITALESERQGDITIRFARGTPLFNLTCFGGHAIHWKKGSPQSFAARLLDPDSNKHTRRLGRDSQPPPNTPK